MTDDDHDVIQRFRLGDEEALHELLGEQKEAVRALVERHLPAHLRRRVAVSDILQETWIVAFERRGDFEDRGKNAFRNWVMGIARQKIRQAAERHLGAAKRSATDEVSRTHRGDTAQFASRHPSPSQVAVGKELAERAVEAMHLLTPDQREVLRLARSEQLPLREVAERMGRSYEATRRFYARSLRRYAALFDALQEDPE